MIYLRFISSLFFAVTPGALGVLAGYFASESLSSDVAVSIVAIAMMAGILMITVGLHIAFAVGRHDGLERAHELYRDME